jgi:hypothetical protein
LKWQHSRFWQNGDVPFAKVKFCYLAIGLITLFVAIYARGGKIDYTKAKAICTSLFLLRYRTMKKLNRAAHDVTIDTENDIGAEHGEPARGHFADPRQGEAFYNPIGDRCKVVFYQVNGTHYEAP